MSAPLGESASDARTSSVLTSPPTASSSERPSEPGCGPSAPLPDVSSTLPDSSGDRPMDMLSSSNADAEQSSYLSRISDLRSRILNIGSINETPVEPPKDQRWAIWHPQSGLFVSPNTTYVPRMEEDCGSKPNWTLPRVLADDDLFMAFRPRIVRHSGDLFGRLNLTNSALSQAVCSGTRGYVLEAGITNRWIRLENALLDLADSLLPKSGIPVISYPRFPYEYGYRDAHFSKDMTVRCAIRSRDAFVELSSLVSFVIALNMDNDGSYEAAFYKLRIRRTDPINSAWLDQLKLSEVCNFSANFRVGIVVNPYTCHWARYLYQFALAHVPIWIFWGHQFKSTSVAYKPMIYFLPPDDVVDQAIDRSKKSGGLILPSYHFDVMAPPPPQERDAFAHEINLPDLNLTESHPNLSLLPVDAPGSPMNISPQDTQHTWTAIDVSPPPPLPESSNTVVNNATARAALEEFFAKRREILEQRIANEDPLDRQRRSGREASAKSRTTFSRKSTVFEWVDMGNGVYERVQLQSKQADFIWSDYTKNQRRYTSYNNQWDLCPQLPKYSEEFPDDNDPNDIDYDDGYPDDDGFVPMNPKKPLTLAIPQDGHTTSTLLDLQSTLEDSRIAVDDEDDPPLAVAEAFDLESFLSDRFGYDLSLPIKWENRREEMEPPTSSTSQHTAPARRHEARRHEDTPSRGDYAPPSTSSARRDNSRHYEVSPPPRMSSSSHRDDSRRQRDLPLYRAQSSSRRDSGKSKGSSRPDKGTGKTQGADSAEGAILSLSKALMSLSFHAVELNASAEAGIINLTNTLASAKGTFINLPANFDHSPSSPSPLSLASQTLELLVVSTTTPAVYILRNPEGTLLADPWMIATKDASTVLLIFRKMWSTVAIIARELTRRGARFNTVKATTSKPEPSLLQTMPLGIRLKGYTPTREDYEEYTRRRNDLLRGPKGRAALMHGGIIARIARDITEPCSVVDGPIFGDSVVCKYGDLFLVDDQLTETDKNIICGVYLAQTEQSPEGEKLVDGAIRQLSWWPQDLLWNSMGCYLQTEWTDLAEVYYEKRCNILQSKLTILGATEWRQTLRKANAWTKKIETGMEHYQREYITHWHHEMLLHRPRS